MPKTLLSIFVFGNSVCWQAMLSSLSCRWQWLQRSGLELSGCKSHPASSSLWKAMLCKVHTAPRVLSLKHPLPSHSHTETFFLFACEGRVGVVREGGESGDCPRSMNHWFLLSMDYVQRFPGKEAATAIRELAPHSSRNPHNSWGSC